MKKIVVPKGLLNLVIGCLLIVVSYTCFAQLADRLPDTLSKKKICGSYVLMNGGSHSDISIKPNHDFSWSTVSKTQTSSELKYKWEIRKDTLLVRETENNTISKRMVMHNGILHFIKPDGSADPAALMTKKDYKFYQRQCRQSGK